MDNLLPIPFGHSKEKYAAIGRGGKWWHFYGSRKSFLLTGDKQENIHRVRITICEDGEYWGWWYADDQEKNKSLANDISMVFPSKMLTEMCFTYGPQAEEKLLRGRLVQLKVEVISEV